MLVPVVRSEESVAWQRPAGLESMRLNSLFTNDTRKFTGKCYHFPENVTCGNMFADVPATNDLFTLP
jgi:hypothetical protein